MKISQIGTLDIKIDCLIFPTYNIMRTSNGNGIYVSFFKSVIKIKSCRISGISHQIFLTKIMKSVRGAFLDRLLKMREHRKLLIKERHPIRNVKKQRSTMPKWPLSKCPSSTFRHTLLPAIGRGGKERTTNSEEAKCKFTYCIQQGKERRMA